MSDQTGQPAQRAQASGELRQRMLEQLDASEKEIEELSDEELEAAAGGTGLGAIKTSLKWGGRAFDVSTIVTVSGSVIHEGKKALKGPQG